MSSATRQRARIARVRHIQHDLAAAESAAAKGKVETIVLNSEHLARLRAELSAGVGFTSGAQMGSIGELALRLDQARDGLQRSLQAARRSADAKDKLRLAARMQQESADKLHDRAATADEAVEERRIAASIRTKLRSPDKGDEM